MAGTRGLSALLEDLSAHGPRPVYLMTGEDKRDLERAIAAVQAACVPAGLEAFNAARLRGLEDSVDDVLAASEILPMMGDRRFVLVREPEKLKGELARLGAYAGKPVPSTTLALVPASLDRRMGWVKALEAAAFRAEFPAPAGAELEAWIRRELEGHGARIEPKALALLVDLVSSETILLSHEIEKVALACKDGVVTAEDVAAALGRSRSTDVWALTNSIDEGDPAAALAALRRLLEQGEAVPMLVGMMDWCLGRFFQTAAPGGPPSRQGIVERRRDELRGRGEELYGLLREADRLVRTTGGQPEAALERFVLAACRRPAKAARG